MGRASSREWLTHTTVVYETRRWLGVSTILEDKGRNENQSSAYMGSILIIEILKLLDAIMPIYNIQDGMEH